MPCRVSGITQNARRSATEFFGPIAQWLEQTTHNRLVGGSNPSGPTIFMSTAGHQLIYDDVCGFCQRSVRLLRRVDWFRTIDPVPMSAAADLMARHSISPDAMMSAMHLVTRQGRVYAGAEAVREFGLRMPLLFPLALAMRLGFVLRLAKWAYQKISANRYRISRRQKGEGEGCLIHRNL